MHNIYSKQIWAFSLGLVMISMQVTAQKQLRKPAKTTFTQGDVFRSAVFLQNNKIVQPGPSGEQILYFTAHDYLNAFFTENEVIYKLSTDAVDSSKKGTLEDEFEHNDEGRLAKTCIARMEWVGANPHPQIVAAQEAEGYYTYLKPGPETFKTLITYGYKTMTYKDLYPGIDVAYSFPEKGGMEYTLVVHPGADLSKVEMNWKGELALKKDAQGNIAVHTVCGDIIEHPPIAYTDNGRKVETVCNIQGNSVRFNLPVGYDKSKTLTIDPWVTVLSTLPPLNLGLNVDYDFIGNLFVYGAGALNQTDVTDFFEITKYNSGGTALWTFNGSVPIISWNTADAVEQVPGNITVDKSSGKVYIGKSDPAVGASAIRLTSAGAYDNFISTNDTTFREIWGFAYNCSNGSVLALGGGILHYLNMGIINTTTGVVTTSNMTGDLIDPDQDILASTYDSAGNLYVILNDDVLFNNLPYPNTLYAVNSTFNGNNWAANTGYTTFNEIMNAPYWGDALDGFNGNWYNALAANGSYIYYFDGKHVVAHNFTNGARVGAAYSIAGYNTLTSGGIAVDNCNHVYVGGIGVIKTFTFNGATFTPGADIPLGGAYSSDTVHDVKYNQANNLLYITGSQVVGTFIATLSTTCNTAQTFTVAATTTCTSATATVTPTAGLTPLTFTYIWTDSTGNVVSQTNTSSSLTNTLSGVGGGTYVVQVQWNTNCGGQAVSDTVSIVNGSLTVTVNNDTICPGASATLTATPSVTGGTYSWSPGGATTNAITVSPANSATYTVTYTAGCGTATGSGTVTILPGAVSVTVNNDTICAGNNAVLTASPSVTGGTYLWSPGGATTSSITVSPTTATTYTVTYTSPICGTATGTGTVTISSTTTVSVNSVAICPGTNATLTATPGVTGGTYLWSPGGGTTSSITVSPTGTTTYTVTYTSPVCGTATGTGTVTVNSTATVSANDSTVCQGGSAILTAVPSITGGTYSWSPGGATTNPLTVTPGGTTTYTVTYTSAACGSATATSLVTVNPTPTLLLTQVGTTCNGANGVIEITAGAGTAPYQYSLNAGAYQLPDSFTALAAGNYTIEVKDANGCNAANTVTVAASVVPALTLTGVSPACTGGSGVVIANATSGTSPYQYSLNGGAYENSDTFSDEAVGFYTVVVKDASGCTATDTVSIIQGAAVTLTLVADSAQCFGANDGAVIATAAGGSAPYQYSLNNGTYQTDNTFAVGAGNYTVEVKDQSGCSASASTQVFQPSLLVYDSIITTAVTCPGSSNGTITVYASGGTPPYSYASTQDGVNYEYVTNGLISDLDSGLYAILLSDQKGCTFTDSAYVPFPVPDVYTYATDSTSCFGSQYNDGGIQVSGSPAANSPFQYALNNGQPQASGDFDSLPAGTYNVTATNNNGCKTTINNIVVSQPPQAFASVLPSDTTIQMGEVIQLSSSFGPYSSTAVNSYLWSPSFGLSCIDCANPVVNSYAEQNAYALLITYNGHCTVGASATVEILPGGRVFIPDVFSPNGDGNNDIFMIYGVGIKTVDLKIFNRWGEKVFESGTQFLGWDGRYKGVLQTPAVFVYEATIYFLDDTQVQRQGSVTLVR